MENNKDFLDEFTLTNYIIKKSKEGGQYDLLNLIIETFKVRKAKLNLDWNINTLFGYLDYYNLPYNPAEVIMVLQMKKEFKKFRMSFGYLNSLAIYRRK